MITARPSATVILGVHSDNEIQAVKGPVVMALKEQQVHTSRI